MRVLMIGGTGVISTAVTALACDRGIELYLLNRGRGGEVPPAARVIQADMAVPGEAERALEGMTFDCVVNWICYLPEQIQRDIRLFSGRTGQYIFISSATVYERPVRHYLITESTPRANPYSEYARNKIACEDVLIAEREQRGFPATIVRPSLTFGDSTIPMAFRSRVQQWTLVDRIRRGLPVIVPGDGSNLWVTTHNTDFAKGIVGLFGNTQSIGGAFHITSDEALTWDQHYHALGEAVGAEPILVHVASDAIVRMYPQEEAGLRGDKSSSVVFDNAKIRGFVPDFVATMRLVDGLKRTIRWFEADPARRGSDPEFIRKTEQLISRYGC